MPLTDAKVRNASAGQKPLRLFDGGGMYVEVSPNGGKWWRLKYRYAGKEKRLSLGVYPETSLKDARDRRDQCRKLLAAGIDPSQHRKAVKTSNAERAANSFEVVAREWFEKHSPSWSVAETTGWLQRVACGAVCPAPCAVGVRAAGRA